MVINYSTIVLGLFYATLLNGEEKQPYAGIAIFQIAWHNG